MMYRFWSLYEDSSCSEAPKGVFVLASGDCQEQVASSGSTCAAQYDDKDKLVGYAAESCHEGRASGFDQLFGGKSYSAYDHYFGADCTDYENSVAFRTSGDCETLLDAHTSVRSATISVWSEGLVWTRNLGDLTCPGVDAPEYFEFKVSRADIDDEHACNNYDGVGGGFNFYSKQAAPVSRALQTATTSPIASTQAPTTTRPAVTTQTPTTTRPTVTTQTPTTTSPPVSSEPPTTTSPAVTTPTPTATNPATTAPIPTTSFPSVATSTPTTTSPAPTTATPTTTSPAWTPTSTTGSPPSSTTASSGSDLGENSSSTSSQSFSGSSSITTPTSDSNHADFTSASSSSSPDSSFSTKSGITAGAIAGISGGAAVLVVVIIVLIWCLCKRNKRRDATSTTSSLREPFLRRASGWTGGRTDGSEPSTQGPGLWNDDAIIASRIPRDQVVVQDLICRGGYGEVFRGVYNRQAVAVKMLFADTKSDLKKVNSLLGEAKLMASLNHPHIVPFVGVAWGSLSDLCVLSELMKGGDLRTLLKNLNEHGHPQGFNYDKIRIAYEIAQALTYLHSLSPIVIHRDLKSRNVLLTEDLEAKLTDFGVSREREEVTMTAGIGTMLWMAPEVMMADRYTEKADIFSFGVLLSELDSQLLPYYHAKYDAATGMKMPDAVMIQRVASGTLQVSFSAQCLPALVQLGKECVALDPAARPSAPMVVFRLQTIMKKCFGP